MEPLAFTAPHASAWLWHRLSGAGHGAQRSHPLQGRTDAARSLVAAHTCPDHPSPAPAAAVPVEDAVLTAERDTARKCCAEEEKKSRLLINSKCTVNGAFFPS